ncbi:hypothetical protein Dimus_005224 [Dionaea muscipula]
MSLFFLDLFSVVVGVREIVRIFERRCGVHFRRVMVILSRFISFFGVISCGVCFLLIDLVCHSVGTIFSSSHGLFYVSSMTVVHLIWQPSRGLWVGFGSGILSVSFLGG